MITPDQFANILINDLDLPNAGGLAIQVATQIRTQLEEYAGVALHPLFHSTSTTAGNGAVVKTIQASGSRDQSATPVQAGSRTPLANGNDRNSSIGGNALASSGTNGVIALAAQDQAPASDEHNPDDTYRCIVTLNIHLQNKLFTDKFEWSLLHPPGVAEQFAKQTCADMGLSGEWIPAMTHAIYEAVLRLKKEACESGGLVGGNGYGIANDALDGQEAGWRYDNEHLADEWEPKIERLSKEEIEKREGDRERQIRRLRRETARFSSTTNMVGGMPTSSGYFDQPENSETPMGRGERSKKKRRFRSLSPLARSGTPGGRGTPDTGAAGYGGGGTLNDWYVLLVCLHGTLAECDTRERQTWRCSHCAVHGSAVWAVRDGPTGPRVRTISLHYLVGVVLLKFAVTLQQLRSHLRARQTPSPMGEKHAYSGVSTGRAVMLSARRNVTWSSVCVWRDSPRLFKRLVQLRHMDGVPQGLLCLRACIQLCTITLGFGGAE